MTSDLPPMLRPPAVNPPPALLRTLPGDYYVSESVFAAEQERIFETMWFCAVRSADLATPGKFKKVQVGRESVLVVRGRDGAAAGVPQRLPPPRGAAVHRVRGGGEAQPALPLPRLDVRAGRQADRRTEHRVADRRDRRGHRPVQVRPRSRRADASGSATPGCAWPTTRRRSTTSSPRSPARLGDADAIDRYGIGGLDVGRRVVYDVAANWKLIVENFMECYHCATIHPELVEVLPEFAGGLAAQYYVGHGAEFGSDVAGFTVDGAAGFDRLPGITDEQDRRYYAITVKPTVFINLVPDHIIFHRMYPDGARPHHRRMRLALHRRRGRLRAATCRTRSSCSTGSTSRTSRPASERSPRCRRGPTATAVYSFLPNTTSRSSTSG